MRRLALPAYAAAVGLVGLVLLVWFGWHLPGADRETPWVTVGLLTAGLLFANARQPVDVNRGRTASTVNISSGFALALVLVGPLGIPMLAHAVSTATQDLRRSAGWMRVSFNSGQAVIAFWLIRLVFESVSGRSTVTLDSLPPREVLALLAGGITFMAVNHLLLTGVLVLASSESVRDVLLEDLQTKLLAYGMDIGVAVTAIPALHYSPLLFPLLVLPVLALYLSSRIRAMKEHEALHDVLTGLPNRALLHENLEDAARLLRPGVDGLAVMLVDLDHFKEINDTLGHPVGDLLLQEVAARLSAQLREDDTVARLGGDEFAVIAHVSADGAAEQACAVGQRLVDTLGRPYELSGVRMEVGGSVGVALAPQHGITADELLGRADIALYVAKERRNCVALYNPSQEENAAAQLALLNELRDGISRREIELHFQPEMAMATREITRMHASVHWRHPGRGLLPPEAFLSLAESTGLIVPLTAEILGEALAQVRRWTDEGRAYGVSVTLSARHLTEHRFPAEIDRLLATHGVAPRLLTLSVTEAMVADDPTRSAALLRALRQRGVGVAVENFGRGHASLVSLRSLDLDEVKIDPTLVRHFVDSPADDIIVRSTVELAHGLGLRVAAAGVHDEDTWDRLHALGCDVGQGSRTGPALPVGELDRWLASRQAASGPIGT